MNAKKRPLSRTERILQNAEFINRQQGLSKQDCKQLSGAKKENVPVNRRAHSPEQHAVRRSQRTICRKLFDAVILFSSICFKKRGKEKYIPQPEVM